MNCFLNYTMAGDLCSHSNTFKHISDQTFSTNLYVQMYFVIVVLAAKYFSFFSLAIIALQLLFNHFPKQCVFFCQSVVKSYMTLL